MRATQSNLLAGAAQALQAVMRCARLPGVATLAALSFSAHAQDADQGWVVREYVVRGGFGCDKCWVNADLRAVVVNEKGNPSSEGGYLHLAYGNRPDPIYYGLSGVPNEMLQPNEERTVHLAIYRAKGDLRLTEPRLTLRFRDPEYRLKEQEAKRRDDDEVRRRAEQERAAQAAKEQQERERRQREDQEHRNRAEQARRQQEEQARDAQTTARAAAANERAEAQRRRSVDDERRGRERAEAAQRETEQQRAVAAQAWADNQRMLSAGTALNSSLSAVASSYGARAGDSWRELERQNANEAERASVLGAKLVPKWEVLARQEKAMRRDPEYERFREWYSLNSEPHLTWDGEELLRWFRRPGISADADPVAWNHQQVAFESEPEAARVITAELSAFDRWKAEHGREAEERRRRADLEHRESALREERRVGHLGELFLLELPRAPRVPTLKALSVGAVPAGRAASVDRVDGRLYVWVETPAGCDAAVDAAVPTAHPAWFEVPRGVATVRVTAPCEGTAHFFFGSAVAPYTSQPFARDLTVRLAH